jgi:hypothetical protein
VIVWTVRTPESLTTDRRIVTVFQESHCGWGAAQPPTTIAPSTHAMREIHLMIRASMPRRDLTVRRRKAQKNGSAKTPSAPRNTPRKNRLKISRVWGGVAIGIKLGLALLGAPGVLALPFCSPGEYPNAKG